MVLGVIKGGDAPLVYGSEVYDVGLCLGHMSIRLFVGECSAYGCLEFLV
jgi:hypothetical protein